MIEKNELRIITSTIERMKGKPHLPHELVSLLGQTALLQAESGCGVNLDLSKTDLSGSPLCPPDRLLLDVEQFKSLAGQILDLILDPSVDVPGPMAEAAQILQTALDTEALNLEAALGEVQLRFTSDQGTEPILTAWARRTPGAPSFLAFIVAAAACPSLKAGAAALADAAMLDQEHIHSQGTCPICGSLPYMLELKGKEGQRFAHCPLCRHTYRIRRLACACCNSDDGDKLKYFTADGEPGYRVETCDNCQTYIKTIDFRQLDREACAPLNDLESLPLDILAGDEGFHRVPSVWCI